jgi:hypothetical protein
MYTLEKHVSWVVQSGRQQGNMQCQLEVSLHTTGLQVHPRPASSAPAWRLVSARQLTSSASRKSALRPKVAAMEARVTLL